MRNLGADGGTLPPLLTCDATHAKIDQQVKQTLKSMKVDIILPFANLSPDCKPIANKSLMVDISNGRSSTLAEAKYNRAKQLPLACVSRCNEK